MSQLIDLVKKIANNANIILWRALTPEEKRDKCECSPVNKKCLCEHYYYRCSITPIIYDTGYNGVRIYHMLSFFTRDDKRFTDYLINLTSRRVSPKSKITTALTADIIQNIGDILGTTNKISHDQIMSLHHFNHD